MGSATGLWVACYVYRADGPVHISPDQPETWEDTRAGANAQWAPLWEALEAHSTEVKRDRGFIWKWQTMKPLIQNALDMQDMAAIQRRVLSFHNPNLTFDTILGNTTQNTTAVKSKQEQKKKK